MAKLLGSCPAFLIRLLRFSLISIIFLCSIGTALCISGAVFFGANFAETTNRASVSSAAIMDRYDMAMTNRISTALDGLLSIEKVFWLRDEDVIAPKPNLSAFGEVTDPAALRDVLDSAEELLNGQQTLFNEDTPIRKDSTIHYYLDDTILAIVWQEQRGDVIYTIAEVKIAHASQFRRFFAGNTYGHDKQYHTTKMSEDVNAIMASSGDFYMYRQEGTVVYNGIVERADTKGKVDTCFIDDKGDLIFSHKGELTDIDQAQRFVDANNIRFSISFGPILIEDGINVTPKSYALGEIRERYPRAALCQAGDLHYCVITANCRSNKGNFPTLMEFAAFVASTGCETAYTLDGGQTATIAMNHQHINPVQYGSQRKISDIFYFATAIPDGG